MTDLLNNRVAQVKRRHDEVGRMTTHHYMNDIATLLEKIKDLEKKLKYWKHKDL